jgi:hypothetical protein
MPFGIIPDLAFGFIGIPNYSHPGRRSFKAELQKRFDRHRPALLRVARFEPLALAGREILGQVISRCNFLATSAEVAPAGQHFDSFSR